MSTMLDFAKKGFFMGLGLASLTKDKLQHLVNEVKTEANLSEEQTRQLQDELSQRAADAKKDLEGAIDQRIDHLLVQFGIIKSGVKKLTTETASDVQQFVDHRVDAALERLHIARSEDVEALKNRLALLEAKLAAPVATPAIVD